MGWTVSLWLVRSHSYGSQDSSLKRNYHYWFGSISIFLSLYLQHTTAFICCCCPVSQLCLKFCDPMDCNRPGLPIPHHIPQIGQVHVHCIADAIQPSHPLMQSSPSTLNLSQRWGLFLCVSCSYQMTKILEFQL